MLAWNPSDGTNVTGYIVYWGVESGNYTSTLDVQMNTNATISVPGTNYIAVTAYSADGESDFSNEVKWP